MASIAATAGIGGTFCLFDEQRRGAFDDAVRGARLSSAQHPVQLHFAGADSHGICGWIFAQNYPGREQEMFQKLSNSHQSDGWAIQRKLRRWRCSCGSDEASVHYRNGLSDRRWLFQSPRISKIGFAMKIDAHQHFWKYDPVRDAWITEAMQAIRRDFLSEDFEEERVANGIDASITVQADQSEKETTFLLELAEHNPKIAGVVGWVDLCSPGIAERLRFFLRYGKLCGFRHVAQAETGRAILDAREFCARRAVFAGVWLRIRHSDLSQTIAGGLWNCGGGAGTALRDRHLAKPGIRTNSSTEWGSTCEAIAQNPNVFCKISGLSRKRTGAGGKKQTSSRISIVVLKRSGPKG